MCLTSVLIAGEASSVTVSPDSPLAGQQVTFTLDSGTSFHCSDMQQELTISSDPEIVVMGDEGVFTYTFTEEGTFSDLMLSCGGGSSLSLQMLNGAGLSISSLLIGPALAASTIPTLGEWGLIILSIILVSIGIVALRQKSIKSIWS